MSDGVHVDREGSIATIVIDRPEAKNAIDRRAMRRLDEIVAELEGEGAGLSSVILTAANDHFIAGGDLKDLAEIMEPEQGRQMSELMGGILDRLAALPCPSIAAIDGDAYGGGCEIALACDLRVLRAGAKMSFRQTAMGLTPGWGGGQRLVRAVGRSSAILLLSSAEPISSDEALRIGLVDRVAVDALTEARRIAELIDARSARAVAACKRIVDVGYEHPVSEAVRLEREIFASTWGSPEHQAAVSRFLSRRNSS